MTAKRIVSLLLALMTLIGVLAILPACSSDEAEESSDITVSSDEIVSDDGLPENQKLGFDENAVNFNKAEITILQRESHKDELGGDKEGNIVDLSTHVRNLYVEEKLGVKFNFVQEVCIMGTNSNTEAFYSRIDMSVLSQSAELDAVAYPAITFVNDAAQSYFADLRTVPNVDLSKAWYNQSHIAASELNGKSYGFAGDVTLSMIDHLVVMFMNIELAKTYYPDVDFYELVAEGEWTYNNMLTMLQKVGDQGDNGNGIATMTLAYGANSLEGFMVGTGINIVSRDNTGRPYISLNNEKNVNLIETLVKLYHDTPGVYRAGSNANNWDFLYGKSFAENKVIFEVFRLNTTEEYYVNSEVKYGILPLPKYDQSQDNYRSAPQGEYSCMCIFDNIGDERKNI